ncbi:MAG: IS30 family transposase [Candidatus Delongbacteria bacterium]|nr:IS30 family transposase [Candidatus Delongbacteria bacterium]
MSKVVRNTKSVYKHLSIEDREEIAILLERNWTQKEIAERLNRNSSTISREIRRNGTTIRQTKYRANRAQLRCDARSELSHKKARLKSTEIIEYVEAKLKKGYSPEQIAGRIGIDHPGLKTNYESIYLYLYEDRPELIQYLVRGRRKRQKRAIKPGKRMVKIPNRIMINDRPDKINDRSEYGHWEADTIVSRQSKAAIAVVRERKLQIMFFCKITRKTAKNMRESVVRMLSKFPKKWRKSITFDNGLENAEHEIIREALHSDTYFCNPYHSWEKGGVENGIGLIRRFLPKKTNFELISYSQLKRIESLLNNRPRKSLGFLTPLEVFNNCA